VLEVEAGLDPWLVCIGLVLEVEADVGNVADAGCLPSGK
jgi:hypothetical protein